MQPCCNTRRKLEAQSDARGSEGSSPCHFVAKGAYWRNRPWARERGRCEEAAQANAHAHRCPVCAGARACSRRRSSGLARRRRVPRRRRLRASRCRCGRRSPGQWHGMITPIRCGASVAASSRKTEGTGWRCVSPARGSRCAPEAGAWACRSAPGVTAERCARSSRRRRRRAPTRCSTGAAGLLSGTRTGRSG